MVPMRALAVAKLVQGPQTVVRYNGYRAAVDQRRGEAPAEFGRRARRDGAHSATTLPSGYSYEWTGTAFQEKTASGHTASILGFALLFAYLFLVALYESWNIPIPALLSVSVGIWARSLRSRSPV